MISALERRRLLLPVNFLHPYRPWGAKNRRNAGIFPQHCDVDFPKMMALQGSACSLDDQPSLSSSWYLGFQGFVPGFGACLESAAFQSQSLPLSSVIKP